MPTKRPTKPTTARRLTAQEQAREDARRALRAAEKREKDIRQLTRRLDRAMAVSDQEVSVFCRNWAKSNGFELVAVSYGDVTAKG